MRVSVTDLVGRPGATRTFARALAPEETEDLDGAADVLDGPLRLSVSLESVVEGILVRGELGFAIAQECARCLTRVERDLDVAVTELFADPAKADEVEDGYELRDEEIDLTTMLRDALVTSLPVRLLCRDDCRGLCATCGADRNTADCGHDTGAAPDQRWSVLQTLRLPPD